MAINLLAEQARLQDQQRRNAAFDAQQINRLSNVLGERNQNRLAQAVGNRLADDDFTGARNLAFKRGALDIGTKLDEHLSRMNERDREQFQQGIGLTANLIEKGIRGPQLASALSQTGMFDEDDIGTLAGLQPEAVMAMRDHFRGGKNNTNFGVGGVWGTDKGGKPVFLQASSSGGLYRPPVPEGVTLTEPPKVVGGSIYGGRTGERKTDVTSDLEAGKAAEARGQATGKREGELPELRLKAELAQDQLEIKQDLMLEDIDRAINKANLWTTGFAGSVLSLVAGTGARDLGGVVDSIQAKVGFDELKAMRDASPTGGALGQVTVREIELLQAVLGDLRQAQTEDQFKYHLRRLKSVMGRMRDVRQKAFERQFGDVSTSTQQSAPSQPPEQAQPQVPDAAIQFLMQNPDTADQFDEKFGQGAAQRFLGTRQ